MEKMVDDFLNKKSFSASAPSSPARLSFENMHFFSIPTSPARKSNSCEDANYSGSSDFEFDIKTGESSPPCKQQEPLLPAMAFADELFSNGKFMPLKPPPRFEYNIEKIESSSGLKPNAVFKSPLARQSLWNDDFDPFMAALKNAKDEKREKIHGPSRPIHAQKLKNQNQNLNEKIVMKGANKNAQNGREDDKIPISVAEPKGVLLARRARQLVSTGNEKPSKECGRQSKRKKIKKFLVRSASMTMGMSIGKNNKIHENEEDKPKDEREELPKAKAKTSFTRKLSLRSKECNCEEKKVSEALTEYRPKLFLCMGYGSK